MIPEAIANELVGTARFARKYIARRGSDPFVVIETLADALERLAKRIEEEEQEMSATARALGEVCRPRPIADELSPWVKR